MVHIEDRKLILTMTDLDHVLDFDLPDEHKNIPPSLVFLGGLANELEMSGLSKNDFDVIKIKLR